MQTGTVYVESGRVVLPENGVTDLDWFRSWAGSKDVPEKCVMFYHRGDWGVDVSREQVYSHAGVKAAIGSVLFAHSRTQDLGDYFPNGVLLVNFHALLSCNPDGLFVTHDSYESKKVEAMGGADSGFVELHGSPDMVLEVVSASSIKKDNEMLIKAYWEADVSEYWLVDARGPTPSFRILKWTPKGYVDVRKSGGWLKSAVYGADFRFEKTIDRNDHPRFHLEIKS